MVGFGFILGGAAKGLGTGFVEQAKAKREAALEELRYQRQTERDQTERDFRAGESQKDRDFRSSQSDADRAFRAEESERTRAAGGDIMTGADGGSYRVQGSEARPIVGPDGETFKGAPKSTDTPAQVQTAEWLIRNGVAADPAEAWDKVNSAKENKEARARLVVDVYKSMKDSDYGRTPDEELRSSAQKMVDTLINGESAPSPAQSIRPQGMDDATVIQQAKDAISKGADAAKVRSRLREMGIDPKDAGL